MQSQSVQIQEYANQIRNSIDEIVRHSNAMGAGDLEQALLKLGLARKYVGDSLAVTRAATRSGRPLLSRHQQNSIARAHMSLQRKIMRERGMTLNDAAQEAYRQLGEK